MKPTAKPNRHAPPSAQTTALLKILDLGNQQIAAGKVAPAKDVMRRLRAHRTAG